MGTALRLSVIAGVAALLGCAEAPERSYWMFPAGKTAATFRADEASCMEVGGFIPDCLKGKGYRQVTESEYRALQQRAQARQQQAGSKVQLDIVAYDTRTGELYVGKSEFVPGSGTSAITIASLTTKEACSGTAEMVTRTTQVTGSIGKSLLLCRDGKTVTSMFVYDSPASGWGTGKDDRGNEYRLQFGSMNTSPDALRESFRKLLEDEGARRRVMPKTQERES